MAVLESGRVIAPQQGHEHVAEQRVVAVRGAFRVDGDDELVGPFELLQARQGLSTGRDRVGKRAKIRELRD